MRDRIHEGIVTRCRREPVAHQLRYRVFMLHPDLDELHALAPRDGVIETSRFTARSLSPRDHSLDRFKPRGPVRLTNVRQRHESAESVLCLRRG